MLGSPYLAEVEFLEEVKNVNGKARKKAFDNDRILSPFYFFLKIKEIENSGSLKVAFYENTEKSKKQVAEKTFLFGKEGKYYEFIIFFDQVEGLAPGPYRYTVFLRDRLIYEGEVRVAEPPEKKHE